MEHYAATRGRLPTGNPVCALILVRPIISVFVALLVAYPWLPVHGQDSTPLETHTGTTPYLVVLGIAQDGGVPQAGTKQHPGWRDPTHKRGYHKDCFAYLDPDTVWGQKYDMYTDKKWQIVELYEGENIVAVMKPRKGEV